jgi:hypothetical protein
MIALWLVVGAAWSPDARGQERPQGFATERFYPSAPGAGWMVMDNLDMHGGLAGAIAVSGGYARDPLRVRTADGSQRLSVVSDQAFFDLGVAVTYDRYRLYLDLPSPVAVSGETGAVGAYSFDHPPSVDLAKNPDTLSDVRIGFDARLAGDARGHFRLGAGVRVLAPSGDRAAYVTDGTYRAMGHVLVAGGVGALMYAAQIGVHVRPLDDSPAPGSPQGSELLFGVAAGPRIPLGAGAATALVVGPEVYGETAFRSFFAATATGLEALLSGRIEGTRDHGAQIRVKLATGVGVHPSFGAPEWRVVVGIEVFDRGGRD